MSNHLGLEWCKIVRGCLITYLLLFPLTLHASFIESTIGTAVVNDATATYYNPAALTLLKNSQIIALGSVAYFSTHFTGQAKQSTTGFTQFGSSNTRTHYYLPSFYLGIPSKNNVTVGLGIISNYFFRDSAEGSLLRYVQSNNRIKSIDLIPALGIKINEFLALGAGLSFTYVDILLQPISGFPSLTIPDSSSRNDSSASGWGGHIGFLLKPTRSTLIGFNYRSAVTYELTGTSILEGHPKVISNDYHFKLWTPARSTFSINQFVTSTLGFIGTIQRIQWSVFKNINIHGIATQLGTRTIILPSVSAPYHFHDAWLLTLGSHFHVTPKWVIRVAGTYNQSPSNGHFQVSNGDSIIFGGSTGYEIYKFLTLDFSYAHVFIKNQNIHITTSRNIINGVNKGFRDAISLKLTFNA